MRHYAIISFFILGISAVLAQDTIQGSYSYTYGDKESLIEARQTCKDLALREAIESYSIFVQSSTDVKNFQTKEDIVQSIALGILHDVRVITQKEEGKTITMTVEATVIPEEVRQMVETFLLSGKEEKDRTLADSLGGEKSSPFAVAISQYERRLRLADTLWEQKNYNEATTQIQKLYDFIGRYRPSTDRPYQSLIYRITRAHTLLLIRLLKVEYLEAQGMKPRARANMRTLNKSASELSTLLEELKNRTTISNTQKTILKPLVSRCTMTLGQAKQKIASYTM